MWPTPGGSTPTPLAFSPAPSFWTDLAPLDRTEEGDHDDTIHTTRIHAGSHGRGSAARLVDPARHGGMWIGQPGRHHGQHQGEGLTDHVVRPVGAGRKDRG